MATDTSTTTVDIPVVGGPREGGEVAAVKPAGVDGSIHHPGTGFRGADFVPNPASLHDKPGIIRPSQTAPVHVVNSNSDYIPAKKTAEMNEAIETQIEALAKSIMDDMAEDVAEYKAAKKELKRDDLTEEQRSVLEDKVVGGNPMTPARAKRLAEEQIRKAAQ